MTWTSHVRLLSLDNLCLLALLFLNSVYTDLYLGVHDVSDNVLHNEQVLYQGQERCIPRPAQFCRSRVRGAREKPVHLSDTPFLDTCVTLRAYSLFASVSCTFTLVAHRGLVCNTLHIAWYA